MQDLMHRVSMSSRNISLTPAVKRYIQKKIAFIKRFDKYIDRIDIVVNQNKAESEDIAYEISTHVKKDLVHIEEKGRDLYSVIDIAHDRLKAAMEKYKDKLTDHEIKDDFHDNQQDVDEYAIPGSEAIDHINASYEPSITRKKTYIDDKPMLPSEAIEQMELLQHTCFLFKNSESNTYAMVYKEPNGSYVLVEPEHT